MSSSSSSSESSSSGDSVLSIHKSNVEIGHRNARSWDPSVTPSDYYPSSSDTMDDSRYRQRYQKNVDQPLGDELQKYWKMNCSDSIGSDRNRRSSFRSDVTGHDPNFDVSAITTYDDSADYPSYSSEKNSMEDSAYRDQYNENICRSLTDEVDSYQKILYDERDKRKQQSSFQSGVYENDADFSTSAISDVGDRWNQYKDIAETTWEDSKGEMDTGEYMDKRMQRMLEGSKSSGGTRDSSKNSSCCCASKSDPSSTSCPSRGSKSGSRSPSPRQRSSRGEDSEAVDANIAAMQEKLANHYTAKYLQSSAGKETRDYHRRMGWGQPQLQRQSTFVMNRTTQEADFSSSSIEGDGDPYANVLKHAEPTMADMIEPESYEWPESGFPSDCNLLDTADRLPSPKPARGTYIAPARNQGTYVAPAKNQGTYDAPARNQGTYICPAKKQGTYDAPPREQGSYSYSSGSQQGSYAEPVREKQIGDGSLHLGNISQVIKDMWDKHYAQKYLESSLSEEIKEYHRYIGMDESPKKQSTFNQGSQGQEADFSLSGIEGDGNPYANVIPNAEPTVYVPWDYGSHVPPAESTSSFRGQSGRRAGSSVGASLKPQGIYDNSGPYKYPSPGSPSKESDCDCATSAEDPPSKQGTYDAPSNKGGTFIVPAKKEGTYIVPAKGQGTSPARRQGTYAASRSRSQSGNGSVDLDSTSLFLEQQDNQYTKKYLESSAGAETKEYRLNMGMDSSPRKQSTLNRGRRGMQPDFSLSSIEGDGDPYANMLPNAEPTVYDAWDKTCYDGSTPKSSSSFRGQGAGSSGAGQQRSQHQPPGSPSKDAESNCECAPKTVDRTNRGMAQKHSTFDRQSNRQEPDFDLSAIEGDGDPFAHQWQGSPSMTEMSPGGASFLNDAANDFREMSHQLDRTRVGTKEYADIIEVMAEKVQRMGEQEEDPNASIRAEMAGLDKDSPEYRQLAGLLEEAEGCPCDEPKTVAVQPRRQIPVSTARRSSSGAHALRPSTAGTRIPGPATRIPGPATRIPGPASRIPGPARRGPPRQEGRPVPGTVTVKPRTLIVQPRTKPVPGTVTIQPRTKPVPGTVTVQPRGKPVPGTVTVQPRGGPQAWPMYDPATVTLKPCRPRSMAPPERRSGEPSPRSRAKSAASSPSSREAPSYPSTPRHRAALGSPRFTGYDERVPRKQPRPALFQSPPPESDPNASLREEMARLDKDSPEYRQLEELLAEAEDRPLPSSQSDPNASLREEMARLDKDSPEYRQLEELLAEAEDRPLPTEKTNRPATAEDVTAYIRSALRHIPHDSVQYAKLMVMLMDVQGWDGNARPTGREASDPCEYIKAEMRNTDRNSTKYIQLEQMLLECEEGDNFVGSSPSPCPGRASPGSSRSSPESGKSQFQRARDDYFRMNPSVDGKRPTGMRKFSEKYPRPDIDFDPMAGPPDYSAYFAGDSPPSNSPLRRAYAAERAALAKSDPPYDPPREPQRAASPEPEEEPEMDERLRFYAMSPRQADRYYRGPQPREREFSRGPVELDSSLPAKSCACSKEGKKDVKMPLYTKTRSLPLEDDQERRYSR